MKLKQLPVIITLAAAFISCVTSIAQDVSFLTFSIRLLIVVCAFYFFGVILQVAVIRLFAKMEEGKESEGSEGEDFEIPEEEAKAASTTKK